MEQIKNQLLLLMTELKTGLEQRKVELSLLEKIQEQITKLNKMAATHEKDYVENIQAKFNGLEKWFKENEIKKDTFQKSEDIIQAFEDSLKKNVELIEYAIEAEKLEQEYKNRNRKLERVVIDINPEREVSGEYLGAMVLYDSGNGLQNCDELDNQTKQDACYLWRKCHSVATTIFYRNDKANANMIGDFIKNYNHTHEEYNDIFIMGSYCERLTILVQELLKGASDLDINVPLYIKYGDKEICINEHRLMENENIGTKDERRAKAQEAYQNLAKLEQEMLNEINELKQSSNNKEATYIEKSENKIEITIHNFKKAIQSKDLEKISRISIEFINYLKSLNNKERVREINENLKQILSMIIDSKKNLSEFTDEEIKDLLKKAQELEKIIMKKEYKEFDVETKEKEKTSKKEKQTSPKLSEDKKEKLNKQNNAMGETRLISVETSSSKKKRRLVKMVESAKDFYKKHKKVILITAGIALLAVAISTLLPSIMAINSNLWWVAINSGASADVGLPVVLHDINMIIGTKIGATYAAGTGVWTLANGATLGVGAIVSGALATLGKVALIGAAGTGLTVAVKNAYNLAKEKISKIKQKQKDENNEKKVNIEGIKEAFKKGYEKSKAKAKEGYEFLKQEKTKFDNKESIKEPEKFYRDDIKQSLIDRINYLIEKGIITKEQQKELMIAKKEEFIMKFREIFNRWQINSNNPEDGEKKESFNREDIPLSTNEFIKYCFKIGVYNNQDLVRLNSMDKSELTRMIRKDPRFIEFEQMRNGYEKEEKREGKSK